MYLRRIDKWGFNKRLKRPEKIAMARKSIERGAVGKHSKFTVHGKRRWRFEFEDYVEDALSQNLDAATPPYLRRSTPEPSSWEARWSADFLRDHAKAIEAYKMRIGCTGTLTGEASLQGNNSPRLIRSNGDSRECGSQELD